MEAQVAQVYKVASSPSLLPVRDASSFLLFITKSSLYKDIFTIDMYEYSTCSQYWVLVTGYLKSVLFSTRTYNQIYFTAPSLTRSVLNLHLYGAKQRCSDPRGRSEHRLRTQKGTPITRRSHPLSNVEFGFL